LIGIDANIDLANDPIVDGLKEIGFVRNRVLVGIGEMAGLRDVLGGRHVASGVERR
jgi:hypothetical protein